MSVDEIRAQWGLDQICFREQVFVFYQVESRSAVDRERGLVLSNGAHTHTAMLTRSFTYPHPSARYASMRGARTQKVDDGRCTIAYFVQIRNLDPISRIQTACGHVYPERTDISKRELIREVAVLWMHFLVGSRKSPMLLRGDDLFGTSAPLTVGLGAIGFCPESPLGHTRNQMHNLVSQ